MKIGRLAQLEVDTVFSTGFLGDFGDLTFLGDSLVFFGEEGAFLVGGGLTLGLPRVEVFLATGALSFLACLGLLFFTPGVLLFVVFFFVLAVDFLTAVLTLSDEGAEEEEVLGAFFVEVLLGEEGAVLLDEEEDLDDEDDFFFFFLSLASGASL